MKDLEGLNWKWLVRGAGRKREEKKEGFASAFYDHHYLGALVVSWGELLNYKIRRQGEE